MAKRYFRLSLITLSIRNLIEHRARTMLGVGIVALGVGTVIGVDTASAAILNSLSDSPDAQTFMVGLLDQFDLLLMVIGLMITVVTGFLMFNSFFLSITQRRQQIGVLRLLGSTRRQVLGIISGEALLIGALGALLGIAVGPLLGQGTIRLIETVLGEGTFTFHEAPILFTNLVIPGILGLGVTLLAVLFPSGQAARLQPLQALQPPIPGAIENGFSWRAVLGVGLSVLLFAALALTPQGGWIGPPWDGPLTIILEAIWFFCLAICLPAVIGLVGKITRRLLDPLSPGTGRLVADNFRRDRSRVSLIVGSFALGLALISALTGFVRFAWVELFSPRVESVMRLQGWMVTPFDIESGMAAYGQMENLRLPGQVVQAVQSTVRARGQVMEWHFVVVPELSFFGQSYFSFLADPESLRLAGDAFFEFIVGDWDFAGPIMDSGCGVLVAPLIAERNAATLGEVLSVSGVAGPVSCRVAGIGSPYVGASLISMAAGPSFGVDLGDLQPIVLLVWPETGTDRAQLAQDLEMVLADYPPLQLSSVAALTSLQGQVMDSLPVMINALSLLAVIAAALGVLNMTMLSVVERRRELALFRAIGATFSQVRNLVIGEAALIGLVGAGFGIFGGLGSLVILVVAYGGRSWGIQDLDLWGAAWRASFPALINGLIGLIAAPILSAAGAWISWRGLVRCGRTAIGALNPSRPD